MRIFIFEGTAFTDEPVVAIIIAKDVDRAKKILKEHTKDQNLYPHMNLDKSFEVSDKEQEGVVFEV